MGNKILILNDFNIVNSSQVVSFYSHISDIPTDSSEILIRIYCDLVNDDGDSYGVYIGKTDSKDKAIDILIKIADKIASAPDSSIVDLRTIYTNC